MPSCCSAPAKDAKRDRINASTDSPDKGGTPPQMRDSHMHVSGSRASHLGGGKVVAAGEGLQWLNLTMKALWPYINKAVLKLLKDEIEPTLQASLPVPLNGIKITSFYLGDEAPELGPVHAYKKDKQDLKGFEIDIFISWKPNLDISMRVLKMKLGLKKLVIEGTVSLVLRPLMETMPVVGGLQIFMINPPTVDVDFTGAANLIDMPVLAGTIRSIIRNAITDSLVLPNRIFVPVADPTEIDMTRLSFPRPEAVLRFQLHKGKNLLAKDFNFFGAATSDPYAIVRVGARQFRSKVIKHTVNPVWQDQIYDFFMFNKRQLLSLELFDSDIDSDDQLGHFRIPVGEIAAQDGAVTIPLRQEDEEEGGGHLDVSLETLKLEPITTVDALPRPELKNPSKVAKESPSKTPVRLPLEDYQNVMLFQCRLVAVRGIPKKFEKDKVYVTFEAEDPKDVKKSGGGSAKVVPALVDDAVPHAMQAMVENLSIGNEHFASMPIHDIAGFAHYPPEIIKDILKRKPSYDTVFNFGCHFLITQPQNLKIEIKVYVNGRKKHYASGSITPKEILSPEFKQTVTLLKRKRDADEDLGMVSGALKGAATGVVRGARKLMNVLSPFRRAKPEDGGSQPSGAATPAGSSSPGGATTPGASTPGAIPPTTPGGGSPSANSSAPAALAKGEYESEADRMKRAWDEKQMVDLQIEFGMFALVPISDPNEKIDFYNEHSSEESDESEQDQKRVGFLGGLFKGTSRSRNNVTSSKENLDSPKKEASTPAGVPSPKK
ncbi:unnamed protein product [Amoebophrya sp. A120]|nr:unnamed protein product [Amoebophrya sp. A120]|eukprot:GSA120T00022996001.1